MRRNDWIALGVSVLLHGMLVGIFALVSLSAATPPSLGYVEVELGPLAEGQPVQQTQTPEAPPKPAVPQTEQPEETLEADEITAQPIDLPDRVQEPSEEQVETPEPDKEAEEVSTSSGENEDSEGEAVPAPPTGGQADGRTGQSEGAEGEGTDKQKSAPFQIEGLDRVTLAAPMPRYADKVNATIRVRITVDPKGRVVRRIPLIKGNAKLEQAVMEALQRWRFNALPANAPQKNQTGTITFRFRLQ